MPLEAFFSASEDERKRMIEEIARSHYKKGSTEHYINMVSKHWSDVEPILMEKAGRVAFEPQITEIERRMPAADLAELETLTARAEKLTGRTPEQVERHARILADVRSYRDIRRLERDIAKVNTQRELEQAEAQSRTIAATDRTRADFERTQRNLEMVRGTIQEFQERARAPTIMAEERREENVNALLRAARAIGVTAAGAKITGTSRVAYREGAPRREFTIRYRPTMVRETPPSRTLPEGGAVWTGPRWDVYDSTGRLVGRFTHKPTAREIRERWRSS